MTDMLLNHTKYSCFYTADPDGSIPEIECIFIEYG